MISNQLSEVRMFIGTIEILLSWNPWQLQLSIIIVSHKGNFIFKKLMWNIYIYVYIHTHTHTYIHTYIHTEKAMAPHSSTLAWKIPWMEEPGRLQSLGSLGVRHDWGTSLSLFTFMRWRRKWQPTPVFLPGESQGLGSLVGCRL